MRAKNRAIKVKQHIDPIITLQVSGQDNFSTSEATQLTDQVSSVCFLPTSSSSLHSSNNTDVNNGDECNSVSSDSQDSSNDSLEFQCTSTEANNRVAALQSLRNRFLVACTFQGATPVYDLYKRQQVQNFTEPRGPGLALRRTDDNNILYQSRDERGTISLHDTQHCVRNTNNSNKNDYFATKAVFSTYSRTFCAACPCKNDANLIAMPSDSDNMVVVRDWRVPPHDSPVVHMHAALGTQHDDHYEYKFTKQYGMLTSLAFTDITPSTTSRPILACGMENGTVYYHDLAMMRQQSTYKTSSFSVSKEAILSLDIALSTTKTSQHDDDNKDTRASIVTIAGMAADARSQSELPADDRGTVAVIKSIYHDNIWDSNLRVRLPTCTLSERSAGRPGVNLCRFRPDGRIFAVGGWDKRLRIFDRSSITPESSPLAILKAHTTSVSAVDWASDSVTSGLLATGASDGQICIWKCFDKSSQLVN